MGRQIGKLLRSFKQKMMAAWNGIVTMEVLSNSQYFGYILKMKPVGFANRADEKERKVSRMTPWFLAWKAKRIKLSFPKVGVLPEQIWDVEKIKSLILDLLRLRCSLDIQEILYRHLEYGVSLGQRYRLEI